MINGYLNEVVPKKVMFIPQQEHFREPWMSVKLCKLNNKCCKLFKKAQINQSIAMLEQSKNYRRVLNRLKLHEKRTFYSELFMKLGKDTWSLWSVLNSLIKKVNNKSDIIELLENGNRISEPSQVSNSLNNHFASVGLSVRQGINQNTGSRIDPLQCVKRVTNSMLLGRVSETEIVRIVSNLKTKFSVGIDGITNNFLKQIINSIKVPLCIIFNRSLQSGVFPKSMKFAKVNALYKGGNSSHKDNYTPISLLPVISKVLE